MIRVAQLFFLSIIVRLVLVGSNDSLCEFYFKSTLPYRLPNLAIPLIYDVKIKVMLNEFLFSGQQKVDLNIVKETRDLVVNGKELKIGQVYYKPRNEKEIIAKKIIYCPKQETIIFRFSKHLHQGPGQLFMSFTGVLNTDLEGFYRSWYKTPDEINHTLANTELEPDGLRRVMPCWDQPDLKAIFRVTLIVPKDYQALSNGEQIETRFIDSRHGQMKEVVFSDTPKMSTYLLSLVVGPYESIEMKTKNNFQPRVVRVYLPAGRIKKGHFALKIARKSFLALHDYFKFKYPLDKLDHIGLPEFSGGAVENYGSILFRQDALELDDTTPLSRIVYIIQVITHEQTHQWMGNLVTFRWWNDAWLNEGFATYFEYIIADQIAPDIDYKTYFVVDEVLPSLSADAMDNAGVVVGSKNVLSSFYLDSINEIYNKASALIKMTNYWIGEKKFHKSLLKYLDKFQFSTATTDDLLTIMDAISGCPVKKVLNTWLRQQGYPIIKVQKSYISQGLVLKLTQSKFSLHGSGLKNKNVDSIWIIPIEIKILSDPKRPTIRKLMKRRNLKIEIPDVKSNAVIKLNPEFIGYYRVQYNPMNIDAFLPFIKSKTMSPLDRANVLNDVLATAEAGTFPMENAFKTMIYFNDDDSYAVWSVIISFVEKVNIVMTNSDGKESKFWNFTKMLFENINNKLGWEPKKDESKMDTLLRPDVISLLSVVRDQDIVQKALQLFDKEQEGKKLNNEIRKPVYETVARDGDDKSFDKLYKIYKTSDSLSVQADVRSSLGAAEEADRIRRILHFGFSGQVRTQDISRDFISPIGETKLGRLMTWDYIKINFDELQNNFSPIFGDILTSVIQWFASKEKIKEIKFFLESKNYLVDGLKKTFEKIELNSNLLRKLEIVNIDY